MEPANAFLPSGSCLRPWFTVQSVGCPLCGCGSQTRVPERASARRSTGAGQFDQEPTRQALFEVSVFIQSLPNELWTLELAVQNFHGSSFLLGEQFVDQGVEFRHVFLQLGVLGLQDINLGLLLFDGFVHHGGEFLIGHGLVALCVGADRLG